MEHSRNLDPTVGDKKLRERWGEFITMKDNRHRQLAKYYWIVEGDKKIIFFHNSIRFRSKRNKICMICRRWLKITFKICSGLIALMGPYLESYEANSYDRG